MRALVVGGMMPSLPGPAALEFAAVVAVLQLDQLLFDRFEFDGHPVNRGENLTLGGLVGETGHGGVDFHELQSDLLTGFLNLGGCGVSIHSKGR